MTYDEAANFKMPWGKHRGLTLDEIGTSDAGLRYLDWLCGQQIHDVGVRAAVTAYCTDEVIAAERRRVCEGEG